MKPRGFRKFQARTGLVEIKQEAPWCVSAASVVSAATGVLFCELCHHLRLSTDLQRAVRPLCFWMRGSSELLSEVSTVET